MPVWFLCVTLLQSPDELVCWWFVPGTKIPKNDYETPQLFRVVRLEDTDNWVLILLFYHHTLSVCRNDLSHRSPGVELSLILSLSLEYWSVLDDNGVFLSFSTVLGVWLRSWSCLQRSCVVSEVDFISVEIKKWWDFGKQIVIRSDPVLPRRYNGQIRSYPGGITVKTGLTQGV